VCREFRLLARDQGICRLAVARHLGLASVAGTARRPEFFHAASRASLVQLQPVDGDSSLAALALRHKCSVADIRRLNGLGSDGALKSYSHVAVPVGQQEALVRRPARAAVRFLGAARREVLLLLPAGRDGEEQSDEDEEEEEEDQGDLDGGRQPIPRSAVAAGATATTGACRPQQPPSTFGAHLKQKLCELVGRAARVDAGTASFYLDEAGGDVASALQTAREDERWAASAAGAAARAGARARWAPLRAFIEAEGALMRA
jgi:hypothetical protein